MGKNKVFEPAGDACEPKESDSEDMPQTATVQFNLIRPPITTAISPLLYRARNATVSEISDGSPRSFIGVRLMTLHWVVGAFAVMRCR